MRPSGTTARALIVSLLVINLGGGVAAAADQLAFGKKLLIKNPPSGTTRNKLVHLAKDATITVGLAGGLGDPQCSGAGGGGGALRVIASGSAGDVTIPLPCAGWQTNGSNSLYKYRDPSGATCKVVLVKNGVLAKAVCGGSQVAIDLNGGMSPVAVVTTLNTQQYCTEFGGVVVRDGSDEKTFQRKDAPAPVSCPTTTTTSTTSTTSSSTSTSSTSSSTSTTETSTTTSTTFGPCAGTFVTAWGTAGSGNGQFSDPRGVAVDGTGNVYVGDRGNNRIQKFDNSGSFVTTWGGFGSGSGQFDSPFLLAVDAGGTVFVADYGNDRVQKFTSTGTYLTEWGGTGTGDGQFTGPLGIAVTGSGDVVVLEYDGNRIQVFTGTGTFVTKWGTAGSGTGQFTQGIGVAIDGSGNVFASETGPNCRVQKFSGGGTFVTTWAFPCPLGDATDGDGNVFVADNVGGTIREFTNGGTLRTSWGTLGSGNGQFNLPYGVAVDGDRNVFVADAGNNRIQKFACEP